MCINPMAEWLGTLHAVVDGEYVSPGSGVSGLASSTRRNSLMIGIYPAGNTQRHAFMSPLYQKEPLYVSARCKQPAA